jgi:hypothetical protein
VISAAAIASLLLMATFAALPAAAGDVAYKINFDGSVQYLPTGGTGKVIVNVGDGSPEGSYNYTATADKGSVTPSKNGPISDDNFTLTVIAPATTGDMTVTVKLSNGTDNTTAKYVIHVVEPVVISATVKNSGNLTLKGVPVQFYVDGTMVNATTFDIDANSTKEVTYRWAPSDLSKGEHTFKVVIDPDKKFQFLSFADGSLEYTGKFYIGDSGWGIINLVLALVLGLTVFILILTYGGRKNRKRR